MNFTLSDIEIQESLNSKRQVKNDFKFYDKILFCQNQHSEDKEILKVHLKSSNRMTTLSEVKGEIPKHSIDLDMVVNNLVVGVNMVTCQRLLNTTRMLYQIQSEFFIK